VLLHIVAAVGVLGAGENNPRRFVYRVEAIHTRGGGGFILFYNISDYYF
jgi:hypothetical protein